MRLPCPYCGERDAQEFVYRGDASPQRPPSPASPPPPPRQREETRPSPHPLGEGNHEGVEGAFFDYVYIRDNPAGPMRELWYHAQGCRNWIVVTRDTRTHEIFGAVLARDAAP